MLNFRQIKEWKYTGTAAGVAACTAVGYLLSGTKVAGLASFADISAAGASGLPFASAVFLGSLVRSIIGGGVGHNIVKLSSLALIMIIKMFLEPRNDPKFSGINTAVSVFVSGAAVSAVIGELVQKLIFYGFYGGIAGFTAYSASGIINGFRKDKVIDLSGKNGFSGAVLFIVLVASLCSVKLPVLNAGIIAGSAVTLAGAYFFSRAGGVICGSLTVCGAFLALDSSGMSIALLPAAALLTGCLHKQKASTAAAFFTATSYIMTVLTGMTYTGFESMIDIICGALIFIPFAARFSDKWISTGSGSSDMLPDVINARMVFLSDTVMELRRESERISDMLAKSCDAGREIEENSEAVCSSCYRRPFCWKSDRGNTYRGFRRLAEMPETVRDSFPEELADCLRKKELSEAFARSSQEKAAAKLMDLRFSESRGLLHEQMKITEELIRSAGERVDVRYSETVSRSISKKLEKFGITPANVIASYNRRGRLVAEVYFSAENAPEESTRVCDLAADELHLRLESTEPVRTGREVRIRVYEKPKYSMEVCAASSCAGGTGDNGDTHTVFTDGCEAGYVVLSDGMGTGSEASLESRMVVGMFRRLIMGGVDHTSAIKLINSIMVTKSGDESFATLDALKIDLDECELTLIKSGAAATLIRHRGNVLKVTSPTFPIGIYEQSEAYIHSCSFDEGDIVIMFSDGIYENAYPFIKELLLGGDDLRHIVGEICAKAEVFNPTIHNDDVTVIGVRVTG